jgi:hypothetical protein
MLWGPLQMVACDRADDVSHAIREILLQTMIGAVEATTVLAERRSQPIRCGFTLQPDGSGIGECWRNNNPWQDGTIMLDGVVKAFARELRVDRLRAFRQFLLFRPTDRVAPHAEAAARAQLADHQRRQAKKWWQFWK